VCVDDFNNHFYDMNIKLPWTVGMTKFYGGWDELYNKLPDGWLYCDADGSQFDSSLSPYLINAVLELRMRFMEEWEIGQQMLRNLYTEIVYTPIATDGTIVKKFKGNNSGQPSTVVDNSLMVVIAMYYSLQQLGYDLDRMNEFCVFFVNGDDLIIAVKPDHERILDHLQNHFSDLGLKYTFADRHMNKSELWFMSHKGIKVNDMYIPKLEQERIVSILEWDRAKEPWHRLEALCAAMIESWGYPELTHEIRKFYAWVLEQAPYNALASEGYAPYISEVALKKLYTNKTVEQVDLKMYVDALHAAFNEEATEVHFQGNDEVDAGRVEEERRRKQEEKEKKKREDENASQQVSQPSGSAPAERDVNVGTKGKFVVPRFKSITPKMKLPKVGGKVVLNLDHLLEYQPEQVDLFNTRSTQAQFKAWYDGVKNDYDVDDEKMGILLNGLMVWCIENGTSPNISGTWVMMDGEEQIEYPIKPLLDHASPTLRQIMAHFSNAAEAYIEMRNSKQYYMPRYGLQRNLTDRSLARYAFDFYEVTPKMPNRAREAHMQMKAAALQNVKNKMFGLDGNVSTSEEDTERHVASDASKEMHNLLGVRM
ncbi:plyprotein, partial [Carnation vein mottle virus]